MFAGKLAGYLGAICAALCIILAPSAWAHSRSAPLSGPTAGIAIPNLSHGQMGIIANHLTAILDLPGRTGAADPTTQRLQYFVNLQYFACMRGLVPGSLADEESPFNECSHAYLAGARALLMHLKDLPGRRLAVTDLVTRIELEMVLNSTSLMLCRYSAQPFNSSEILAPHWRDIPAHPPSLATFGGLALGIAGCVRLWMRPRRPRANGQNGALA